MSERLLTFAELSEDRYILEGRLVEFPLGADQIYIGEVITTAWWPRRHIREIQLVEGKLWDETHAGWIACSTSYLLKFKFEDFEMFNGPYETGNGEIFFIFASKLYVRFFQKPMRCAKPLGFKTFQKIHDRFINP